MNVIELKEEVRTMLNAAPEYRVPMMVWSAPGIGKSQAIAQVAKEEGVGLVDLRLNQLDPVDLRGLPMVSGTTTTWATPAIFPTSGRGILLLEELPQSPPSIAAVMSQIMTDHRYGDYILPEGWIIVATGNRTEDRAATHVLPTHISNRAEHLFIEPDLDVFCRWALGAKIHPAIYSFVRWSPDMLHQFDPRSGEMAFASPRSWDYASRYLHRTREPRLDRLTGIIGKAPAGKLYAYLQTWRDLPDMDRLLADPTGTPLPSEVSALWAVLGGVVARATKANIAAVVAVLGRLPIEYSVKGMRDLGTKDPALLEHSAVVGWFLANRLAME